MICIEECDETIISRRQAEQKEEEWRVKLKPQIKIETTSISEEKKIDNSKYIIYKFIVMIVILYMLVLQKILQEENKSIK